MSWQTVSGWADKMRPVPAKPCTVTELLSTKRTVRCSPTFKAGKGFRT